MFRILMASLLSVVCACASVTPSFPVIGVHSDFGRLVGRWDGDYVGSISHGRRGTIAFVLAAAEDHAHGTVEMIPDGDRRAYGRVDPGSGRGQDGATDREATAHPLLTIRFVWVTGSQVEGVLDAYWDPDRATAASTTFRGHIEDNSIRGTFVTEYANRAPATSGVWTVRRR
jgi:hypothetical protein